MSEFIFRMPAGTPDLDFTSLEAYIRAAYDGEDLLFSDHAEIGTTVQVVWRGSRRPGLEIPPCIDFSLYDTVIARIYQDRAEFPVTGDTHMATTEWIARIVRDNAIGGGAGRIRRRAADPLVPGPRGYVGPLAIDYDREQLVEGHAYPAGDIEGMRRRNAEQAAKRAIERERLSAEWSARQQREDELKTWTHPQYGPLYAIEGHDLDHGFHWRVADGSYFDTIGYIRDTRVTPGDPPYMASPEPSLNAGQDIPVLAASAGGDSSLIPVFTAFAGSADHRQDELGPFPTVAEALAAVAEAEKDTLAALTQAAQDSAARAGKRQAWTDAEIPDGTADRALTDPGRTPEQETAQS
jgi:hypothetical protein